MLAVYKVHQQGLHKLLGGQKCLWILRTFKLSIFFVVLSCFLIRVLT